MSATVHLLLGVHAHQPVGNFLQVVDEAHARCYLPFLRTLHRYPQFRFAAHLSGWLLETLRARYPQDMELLRAMVRRGQVELFGGGDSEPVLAAIPERDRVGQIQSLSNTLERWSAQRPEGAWLTERVWEATVVPALRTAGIDYVTVDDYHFLCTGLNAGALGGYYTTEENGHYLDLFPISEALRYRLPFAPASEAVAYLESLADDSEPAAIYFDDIEKFGIWPETYEWVYEKGWLEQFVQGVLASKRIRTNHYRDYRNEHRTRGMVYLPTTSYREMNEWSLPADAAATYASLETWLKKDGQHEQAKPFLRGGIWRNFLTRYPESNWMHKRMLALSQRVAVVEDAGRGDHGRLRALLYRAQANDAYWHGLFGGLYLPHLRRAVYNALVELEAQLDRIAPRPTPERADADHDGVEEVFLHNAQVQLAVVLDGSGSVREFDSYRLKHNFCDVLARQTEHYYCKVQDGRAHAATGSGIASAHDRVTFKHEIAREDLEPAPVPIHSFRDEFWHYGERLARVRYELLDVSVDRIIFGADVGAARISKTIRIANDKLSVQYRSDRPCTLSTQLDLALPSCDGPAGRYWIGGHCPGGFGQPLRESAIRSLVLEDDVLGGRLELRFSAPVTLSAAPYHTVSQSEAGFEKIMQSVNVKLHAALEADQSLVIDIDVLGTGH